jgi:hypothetical protein
VSSVVAMQNQMRASDCMHRTEAKSGTACKHGTGSQVCRCQALPGDRLAAATVQQQYPSFERQGTAEETQNSRNWIPGEGQYMIVLSRTSNLKSYSHYRRSLLRCTGLIPLLLFCSDYIFVTHPNISRLPSLHQYASHGLWAGR